MRRLRALCSTTAALLLLSVLASPADAHLMTTGLGPFYDGLTHVFVTPEDLLEIVALALLAGLGGARPARATLFALPLAWFGGDVAGTFGPALVPSSVTTAAATVVLGALVAADLALPPACVTGIAIAIGLLEGVRNGVEVALAGGSALVGVGATCALFVLVSLLSGQVVSIRAPWARLAVRVGGSWIAAIGLLMVGWSLRPT